MFSGSAAIEQEQMYKFFEPGSRIMVLRPDVTMPIARIAATKLKSIPLPIRLSYISSVYRYEDLQSVKQREIAQAGIELLGSNSPEADAEVIALAIESLLTLGLSDFQIDIGQVEFYKGLVEEAGLTDAEAENLRHLIDQKNVLALEMLLKQLSIPAEIKNNLLQLPMFFDNGDLLNTTLKLTKNVRCTRALENIAQVYRILKNYGVSKYIAVDLGMVQSLEYYTGIIFRGITKDFGYPICGGGRYDNLAAEFGADMPATGFAIGLKRILVALEHRHGLEQIPDIDVLFVHDPIQGGKGYDLVQKLRAEGFRVEVFIPVGSSHDFKSYARKKGIHRVFHLNKDRLDEIEIR
jgi:ATP phosphoribosyltransferase regulatory subunit